MKSYNTISVAPTTAGGLLAISDSAEVSEDEATFSICGEKRDGLNHDYL